MVTELVTLTYPVVEILKINVTPLKCFFLIIFLHFVIVIIATVLDK